MKTATLNDRAIVIIAGEDAEHFLENLVTCKIIGTVEGEAAFGALLTPQGKIMYDFFLLKQSDGFLIDILADLAEEFVKRLTFYRLRAKVEISAPQNRSLTVCWNCDAPEAILSMQDPRHPDLGFRIYEGSELEGEVGDYAQHRIEIGIPEGSKDFDYGDAYPHETLMDQFGGVDFKKGCYVGQEVVSRMQHRGTAKKRVVRVVGDANLPHQGEPVTADGKPAGTLGSVCDQRGLALLRLDRVARAETVLAGNVTLSIEIPEWVSFELPVETA